MNTYKHKTYAYLNETLVGKLFKEGEVSENNTMVVSGASVRLAGTAMFLEHEYPDAEKYRQVGEVKEVERLDDGTWVAYFEVYDEKIKKALLNGELALSVSWVASNYDARNGVATFSDIAIYEVSIVGNPAFNTCAAESVENLACIHKNEYKHCGCGKPIRPKHNSIFVGMKHQSVEERLQMLEDAVSVLKESIDTLTAKYDELVSKMEGLMQPAPEASAITEESVQHAIAEAEKRLSAIIAQNDTKIETLSEHLLKLLENLKRL